MVVSEVTSKAIWIKRFLGEFGFTQPIATMILIDNQGSIAFFKNHVHHNKTKHIDIRHHYVREMVIASKIEFEYCNTFDMSTDLFTKPLSIIKPTCCMQMLGLKKFDQGEVLSI